MDFRFTPEEEAFRSEFVLDKGDCIYFDSSVAHTGEPIGVEPLKTLIVLYTGSPKGPTSLEHIKRRIVTQQ